MTRHRVRLPLSLLTAVSLASFGCTTVGTQAPTPATPSVTPPSQAVATPVPTPSPSEPPVEFATLPSDAASTPYGVKYVDFKVGTGVSPQPGQTCVVNYTGWLKENGKKFDSSFDRGQTYQFQINRGKVIRGWDEGVATMKVGGKRKLEIPPNLAYGEQGTYGIPSNATLIFYIELLEVK